VAGGQGTGALPESLLFSSFWMEIDQALHVPFFE